MSASRQKQSTGTRIRRALSGLLLGMMVSAVGGSLWAIDPPPEGAEKGALVPLKTSSEATNELMQPVIRVIDPSGPSDTSWSWFNVGLSNQLKQASSATPVVLDAY